MKDNNILDLIKYLLEEREGIDNITIPYHEQGQFLLYRSLVNIRPPMPISEEYLQIEDTVLSNLTKQKGITDISDLDPIQPHLYLWKGDITTLKCDAIVNAANSGMTGCYQPCHNCIDNCIHTFAGIRLRYQCSEIMSKQGHPEPTGSAKITPAYNLPCRYVIHTVGAIVDGELLPEHCEQLRNCYISCLKLAVQNQLKHIAFCCISTGVFGFPQEKAAEIAVDTVKQFQQENEIEVIFNVYTETDFQIYRRLLQ